ncbi:MAG: ATP-binding cassette domain-containing protein, partial [Candidatus Thorarchaeota archaeon]
YDPQEGNILIGDQDLREITLDSLHGTVALIPQEPYLFDASVMDNIRYGRPGATDDEIKELCGLIGANDFIEVLADGYDTCILENGKNLSAGQRQMITIARTMLANPRILILDEATSRLDAYSESLVQDAQAMLFSDRTTVVIAHRLTTIANASRIIVFEDGEIIEDGTHSALESPQPSGGMGMMGMMGGGESHGMPGGGHGGMSGGGMKPPPEMMKMMMEHPENIPPPMRSHLIERLEHSDNPKMKDLLQKLKDLEKESK